MKILNFGSCNIDYVYSLAHIVSTGETEAVSKLEIFPGGKGLNQSVAAAKAGVKVYHAGCIGCDGDMLEEVLGRNGVDISCVEKIDGKNGHAIIQVILSPGFPKGRIIGAYSKLHPPHLLLLFREKVLHRLFPINAKSYHLSKLLRKTGQTIKQMSYTKE